MSLMLRRFITGLLIAAFCLMIPVPECRAAEDDSNLNKGALVGLFLVVVGVLLWVGFRSDMNSDRFAALRTERDVDSPDAESLQIGSLPISFGADGIGVRF